MSISHKSTLAKLLATENLRIEHQKVPTAMFDLKNRTLILPIWKDMSSDLYDLLIGHEVGHALFTPAQGWHSELDARGMGIKSYLNVLEDARIERKIKDKFPGIRRNFFAGYKELFDNNFFGVKGYDLSKLRLIDRINLHYKVGSFLNAPFSADENQYLARVDALETWDDVAALAVELYELAKSEPEHDFDSSNFMGDIGAFDEEGDDAGMDVDKWISEMDDESTDADETAPSAGKSADSKDADADSDSDKSDASADGAESNEDGAEEGDSDEDGGLAPNEGVKLPGSNDTPILNDDPISITDQNFRDMEDTFIDSKSREYAYGILRKVDTKNYVIPMDWVLENMRPTVYSDRWYTKPVDYDPIAQEVFAEFRNNNQKYINTMVQEFEMRRRASEFARAQTSKTGRLDVDRVWAHKISEDLFARNTVVPNGKNHGMLLFLDMSGSMAGNMRGTIEQLVTLMMFCRKVRIPFEVYGFTNNGVVNDKYSKSDEMRANRASAFGSSGKELEIGDNCFNLLQFVSDNCSVAKFNEVIRTLLMCARGYDYSARPSRRAEIYVRNSHIMGLASTPLEESIMVARSIADKFRAKNRVEVLNTVFLTDGDGDNNIGVGGRRSGCFHVTVTDASTNASVTVKYDDEVYRTQLQVALLELYKKATGSRLINFFIASYNPKWAAKRMHNSTEDFDTKWKNEWKQKFFHTTKSFGFDDRFLIPGGSELTIGEDIFESNSSDPKDLRRAFKKFQNTKQTNRVLLNKMIQAVA
jgi:hypothetical protein